MAGTTGLEPATFAVTGLDRMNRISFRFQRIALVMGVTFRCCSWCYSFRQPLYASSGIQ